MRHIRIKKYITPITNEDRLDITLYIEDRIIIKFALNYRGKIEEKWHEIYRVDNFHGFLHEQKFWITEKPIPVPGENIPLRIIVEEYKNKIMINFLKYKEYYKNRMKENEEKNKR